MKMICSTRPLVLAAALLALPASVLAQSATAPAPAAPREAAGSAPGSAPGGATTDTTGAEARVEARIKELHGKLRITPAQQSQWDQFAQVMRANARDMNSAATQRAQQLSSMNAVQDMQSYEQLAEAHVQRLQKLIPAFEALYNSMSPEQKQAADQSFRANAERRAQGSSRQ